MGNDTDQVSANDPEQAVTSTDVIENDAPSSIIKKLSKALVELKACKNFSNDNLKLDEIEEHFISLDMALKKESEDVEAKENKYKAKEAEISAMLAKREEAVISKEQELHDQLQKLRDSAIDAITEARANHLPAVSDSVDTKGNKRNKVSSSLCETNSPKDFVKMGEKGDVVLATNVKPIPDLIQICELMDAEGILNFTIENQKSMFNIREELSIALERANEPARLVLDAIEGFYPPYVSTKLDEKEEAALQGMRKSCVILMEALVALSAGLYLGVDQLLNPDIKKQAKEMADEWNLNLVSSSNDAPNGNSLETEAFLQLLTTFRIASEFDDEEFCKFVLVIANISQAPELCRSLGLTQKIRDIIETLISCGKQIDAVQFIHKFQLSDRFPLVPLLKAYLKELRRNSQGSGDKQIDVNAQELAALKAVVKSVEECKLEAEYPLDPLRRRVAQLEGAKSDKKRFKDFGRNQQNSKKSRTNGGYRGLRQQTSRAPPPPPPHHHPLPLPARRQPRPVYTAIPERSYQYAGPTYDYQVPGQSAYAQQTNDPRYYPHHTQDVRNAADLYNMASSTTYAGYTGGGMPHQPYM